MRERLQTALVKKETNYGQDPTPTTAANTIEISDLNVKPMDLELVPRELVRNFLGNSDKLPAASWKTVDFTSAVAGAGAAGTAPKFGPLLLACAMAETINVGVSVLYKFKTGSEDSATGYFNYDGQLHKLLGGRGTWTLNMGTRKRPTLHYALTGLFAAITDAALPAIDLTGWTKPIPVNSTNTPTVTVHGYAAKLLDFELQGGVEVQYTNLGGGLEQVEVVDREPKGSITIEMPTIAQKDFYTIASAGTAGAVQILHGTTAGNKFQTDLAAAQIDNVEIIKDGKRRYLKLGLWPMPTAAGNDEVTFTVL